jgi:hypothetical protein
MSHGLTKLSLGHEDVWGNGCIDPHYRYLGTINIVLLLLLFILTEKGVYGWILLGWILERWVAVVWAG